MTPRGIDLHLPSDVVSVQAARHAVRDQLAGFLDAQTQGDAELLVSELVTNGVQHGPGGPTWIDVHLRMDKAGITVEVSDSGEGFDPDAVQAFDPDAVQASHPERAGGWGLALVSRLADRWGTRQKRNGTAVWFRIDRVPTTNAL